ncbi:hypothetical protein PHLCEN_2v11624 [Hermanssonia centrifuga]|uniref:Dynamin-type G domain-containing protein n=1 Tax=Hermanssonia centrifuga TaxID=98765 RepID=A0A2R6NJJ0_9APHY|nr:hypothetical protein PHLCEN_2v11624 [Hermanssonia centrifuga]
MSHASDSSLSGSTEPILITNPHSDHARKEKQHSTIINKLRAMGANAVIDLPRITVIGNQSAGKSSLVEGISGINVPRDAGTCTRCPIECRLASSSEPWSGRVHIRREFDTRGKRLDVVGEEPFGPLLTDKQDIEGIIRRAQAALLNPGVEQSTFLHMPDDELKVLENELKFSRNTVCLDLTGPELADLAFVDLPGIVANADDDTVRLVEDLVISNIKGNCLILVTLPMSDDIENQKAARLAKQEDPSGIRTIGVLTKPDTLAHGATHSRELWLEVIKGRRFPLHHGYYCTRQPDDDERARGITTAQARAAEKDYFASIPPWSTLSEQHRLGKDNLVSALSRLFVQRADDA